MTHVKVFIRLKSLNTFSITEPTNLFQFDLPIIYLIEARLACATIILSQDSQKLEHI